MLFKKAGTKYVTDGSDFNALQSRFVDFHINKHLPNLFLECRGNPRTHAPVPPPPRSVV